MLLMQHMSAQPVIDGFSELIYPTNQSGILNPYTIFILPQALRRRSYVDWLHKMKVSMVCGSHHFQNRHQPFFFASSWLGGSDLGSFSEIW
jgi:hypothetical protein